MGMMKEFRDFAVKGNAMDMAVGVIIGAAFGKIITSLVSDIIMPPLGLLVGKVDFKGLFVSLDGKAYVTLEAAKTANAPVLTYGMFLQTVFDFAIVAMAIFMIVKMINSMRREEKPAPAEPPKTPEDILLLREIRDSLAKR
jgi:large conductance mechanosensitive channel